MDLKPTKLFRVYDRESKTSLAFWRVQFASPEEARKAAAGCRGKKIGMYYQQKVFLETKDATEMGFPAFVEGLVFAFAT